MRQVLREQGRDCQVSAAMRFSMDRAELTLVADAIGLLDATHSEQELAMDRAQQAKEFESTLEGMRERDRRSYLRKLQQKDRPAGEQGEDDGHESYDEEDDMDDI